MSLLLVLTTRIPMLSSGMMYHYFFFFNDTAPTEIYTLSLHDALPIYLEMRPDAPAHGQLLGLHDLGARSRPGIVGARSEEHTSELQSRENLVCRLLLEKKKKNQNPNRQYT